jgi:hypothetical protein
MEKLLEVKENMFSSIPSGRPTAEVQHGFSLVAEGATATDG